MEVLEGYKLALNFLNLGLAEFGAELIELLFGVKVSIFSLVTEVSQFLS